MKSRPKPGSSLLAIVAGVMLTVFATAAAQDGGHAFRKRTKAPPSEASRTACHTAGGIGGASDRTVTRFGRQHEGGFDDLAALGGSLLQALAIAPEALESVPPEANVVAQRVTTPLFGAGLIEAIPDETIANNARRQQPDGHRTGGLRCVPYAGSVHWTESAGCAVEPAGPSLFRPAAA